MPKSKTPKAIDAFVALHDAHFSHEIIAKATGFSRSYVRKTLAALGKTETWSRYECAMQSLPGDLAALCQECRMRHQSKTPQ